MQFHDKLFQLRRKEGLTQAELAEALNVSRQAVSKWEMGTAIPDVANMLGLSKIFSVSIDYLVSDEMSSDMDAPAVKATAAVFKLNYQYVLKRVIAAVSIIAVAAILGVTTHTASTMLAAGICACIMYLIYCLVKLLLIFFSNKKH
jgi:transcriptional regulator with XRE-family HTH domain